MIPIIEDKVLRVNIKQAPSATSVNFTYHTLESAIRSAASATMSTGTATRRVKRTFQGGQAFKFCVFPGNYPQYIRDALTEREGPNVQWIELEPSVEAINLCDFIWKPFNYQKIGFDLFERRRQEIPKNPIVYNHFENISLLSTKTGLLKTLKEYYHNQCKEAIDCKYRVQDTLPMAYMITSLPSDPEFLEFKKKFKQIDRGYYHNERMAPKHLQQNFWLLKPSNLNQGKGIEIFNSLKQLGQYLQGKPHDMQWIVQKYIEKPLLYNKRKFDIRVLALATNEMDLFFYETGYMRTSSDEYSLDNKNKFIHLTNNCYQKYSNNYEKFEEGNQLSFAQFQSWLDVTFPELNVSWKDHLLPRIKDLVIDCFVAAVNNLNPKKLENCFELMGFDFLIDEDFRVWLIEVNTNPYFGVVNNSIPGFISNLVDDTFKLTLDKTFPVGYEKPFRKDNLYELLYSHSTGFSKRRSFTECLYPVPAIKEMLDKEREQMLQQKFPQKTVSNNTANNNGEGAKEQAKASMLPNIVKSAGIPQVKKAGETGDQQSNGQAHRRHRQPLLSQAARTQASNPSANFNGVTPNTNSVVPQTGQSNRQKSLLSPMITKEPNQVNGQILASSQALPQDDYISKKHTSTHTKFRNPQQSEDRQKTINSTRRRLLGKLDQSSNNTTSLGRPFNRDQSSNALTGFMGNRRGTTPAVKEGLTFASDGTSSQQDLNSPAQRLFPNDIKGTNVLPAPQYSGVSPGRQTHSKLQQYQTSSSAMHGTNLSVLLKKKNDENLKANQQSQNEYLTKIQKMLKVKSIVDQVKDSLAQLDSYEQKRKDFVKIFSQIYSIFSDPDRHPKKEVANAVTALRMMIYSQFIIHFNDKSVLTKLLEVLKLPGTSSNLDIKEAILRNLAEISKHHSIRGALLNRKLLSKIMKAMYEHVATCLLPVDQKPIGKAEEEQPLSVENRETVSAFAISQNKSLVETTGKGMHARSQSATSDQGEKSTSRHTPSVVSREQTRAQEIRILNAFSAVMITLGSVSNSKFYIPGETKEVESLRRKAIMNGILIFIQAVIQQILGLENVQDSIKDIMKKLQVELLETVDASDFRLHLYTVFSILKQRLFFMRQTEIITPIIEESKSELETTLLEISQERLYQQIKTSLENQLSSGTKSLKIKVPHFLEQLDSFITPKYLKTTYSRYKLLIDYVQPSQPAQTHTSVNDQQNTKKRLKHLASANYESSLKHQAATLLESQIEQIQVGKSLAAKQLKHESRTRAVVISQKSQKEGSSSVVGELPPQHASFSNMPEIVSGGDIQEQLNFADISALNLPNQNQAFRNTTMNGAMHAKSINHVSEKATTLGVVRTISSDLHQPLVLPNLEPMKKQQSQLNWKDKDSQQNPLYFMKLQPYLKGNKVSTRLSVAKKTMPPYQSALNGYLQQNLNAASSFSVQAGIQQQQQQRSEGFSLSNVKKQFNTESQGGMFGPIKSGKQTNTGSSGVLRRLKNNINTQSGAKMPAIIVGEESEHGRSKETLGASEDPYRSVKHVSSKGNLMQDKDFTESKKRPALPLQQSLIQNQQRKTSPKFNINNQSATEILYQAIKITDDETSVIIPSSKFEDGSLVVQTSMKEV